jgi:hypothetical protein
MERLILSVVGRHPLDSASSLGKLNTLHATAVVTEGTLPAVEIIVTGRDAAVAAINQNRGGLRDIDAIVQGGTEDVVPDQMADDHEHDGMDGRSQHGRLAGHEEALGAGRDGEKNAGRQKEEQKATEQVHLYLNAGL